jgi:rsbT co-antagonist protein RsbR
VKPPSTLDEFRAENATLRARIDALEAEKAEREQVHADVEKRFARLQRVLAELPLIVDIFDITARRSVFKNRDLDLLMGYAPGAIAAMGPQPVLYKVVHPDDIPRVVEAIQSMLDERNPAEGVIVEYRVRRGDDNPGWFRSELNAFERSPEGRTVTGLMVTYDITEAKLAEEALRALNAELDALVAARTAKLEETNEQLQQENMLRTAIAAEAEARARVIRALGSPILQLQDDVLAMPIIGTLDEERAAAMSATLLEAISRTGARFSVIDLTAVGAMDDETTTHLQALVRAISLLGTEVVISGIGANIARIMVQKGLRTEGVTVRSLSEALRYCMRRRRA